MIILVRVKLSTHAYTYTHTQDARFGPKSITPVSP